MSKVVIGQKTEVVKEQEPRKIGGLLKKAVNGTAFAKIGLMGFAGSGKSLTATKIAIGLAKTEKDKARHNVAFFDSEKGSDFLIKRFQEAGVDLYVHKGRAFKDLIYYIRECEASGISVLIIDSISHVWRDLCDSYQERTKKQRLTMNDWNILKKQWKEFTDLFIGSSLHIIMCGRAGYEYDMQENDDGKNEMIKTGTKMKVEGETGFEPDLLLEMERVETKNGIINRCWVLKDRSDTINGKSFDMPTFETYRSFYNYINLGGSHAGVDTTRNSAAIFSDPDWSVENRNRKRDIALEELNAILIKLEMDGTGSEAKKNRVKELEEAFGTSSKTAIENMHPDAIEECILKIKRKFAERLGYVEPKVEPVEKDVSF